MDVLVSPAYQPAWKSDLVHGDQVSGGGANCTPPAILGWPILTVPMGTVDGLPVGFSIVGQAHSEPLLIAVGHALETALGLTGSSAIRPHGEPRSAADPSQQNGRATREGDAAVPADQTD